jgi:threonine dehydrogenase-like Zn-dependent dehydrogenase
VSVGRHDAGDVFHEVGDIRLEEVPEPTLQQDTDAIVRLTASAICGTDLHQVRGTIGGDDARDDSWP